MSKDIKQKLAISPAAAPLPRYRVVADQIAELIRQGALEPGQKMPPDVELVELLQVSRPTIREAMISLEMMGYVETRFGYGAFVAQRLPAKGLGLIDNCSFSELVEARYWFEADIAAVAALTISKEKLAELRDILERMKEPDLPVQELDTYDFDFHMGIAQSTQNNMFISIMDQLWSVRERFPNWARIRRQILGAKENIVAVQKEHEVILEALEARDPAAAHRAMQIHCKSFGVPFLEEGLDGVNASDKDDIVLTIMNRLHSLEDLKKE
ncbi:FadR/GntR family transcriptional regulator [uncultured Cohaesibacter sp.]|uniref:FadR/GntR family transcriptional regulator n=1 Tax=uncultured Cohaesibacter sp. TaxID=1002546 RepID=UPI0029C9A317|nr:FadR/GntR family transcriptional regulator [uncultured Cohaesibacter sp.]